MWVGRCTASHSTKMSDNFLFCIIAARRANASYVHRVVDALGEQTPVQGVLVDVDDHYSDVPMPGSFVRFVPSNRNRENCDPDEGDIGRPNCVVRQQTRDVALGLRRCTEVAAPLSWVVMLEDDMLPCDGSVDTIARSLRMLDPATVQTMRFAKFSRAVAFPPPRTALLYSKAILEKIESTPYDLVLDGGWGSGASLVHQGGSLFSHIGAVSTTLYRNDPAFQRQWGNLRSENCGDRLE